MHMYAIHHIITQSKIIHGSLNKFIAHAHNNIIPNNVQIYKHKHRAHNSTMRHRSKYLCRLMPQGLTNIYKTY